MLDATPVSQVYVWLQIDENKDGVPEDTASGAIKIDLLQDMEVLVTGQTVAGDGIFGYTLPYGEYEISATFKGENGSVWGCFDSFVADSKNETVRILCTRSHYENHIPHIVR